MPQASETQDLYVVKLLKSFWCTAEAENHQPRDSPQVYGLAGRWSKCRNVSIGTLSTKTPASVAAGQDPEWMGRGPNPLMKKKCKTDPFFHVLCQRGMDSKHPCYLSTIWLPCLQPLRSHHCPGRKEYTYILYVYRTKTEAITSIIFPSTSTVCPLRLQIPVWIASRSTKNPYCITW